MTSATFDGLTLNEPKWDRKPKPQISSDRLVSGKKKVTTSSEIDHSFSVTCLAYSLTELNTIIAKFGVKGTLILGTESFTNCAIESYNEKELNPTTWQVKLTFEKDTT